MSLTIGSLFSGIGGLELGLERAGLGPVLWQVEIDPFCREVLAHHWPKAERFDDVRTVGANTLARVDVLCGGFPCQDVSLAGRGAGLLAGERTGLWREFARLVREQRPRYVIAENVPGLTRRGLDVVVADLTAAGYAVEAARIAAADLGAPHRRDRLFIVAHRDSAGLRDEPWRRRGESGPGAPIAVGAGQAVAYGHGFGCEGERRGGLLDGERSACRHNADGCCGEAVADAGSAPGRRLWSPAAVEGDRRSSLAGGPEEPRRHDFSCWPPTPDDLLAWGGVPADSQPSVCRLADGIPARLARRRAKLKALGNAVVPACAEIAGRRVLYLEAA